MEYKIIKEATEAIDIIDKNIEGIKDFMETNLNGTSEDDDRLRNRIKDFERLKEYVLRTDIIDELSETNDKLLKENEALVKQLEAKETEIEAKLQAATTAVKDYQKQARDQVEKVKEALNVLRHIEL